MKFHTNGLCSCLSIVIFFFYCNVLYNAYHNKKPEKNNLASTLYFGTILVLSHAQELPLNAHDDLSSYLYLVALSRYIY